MTTQAAEIQQAPVIKLATESKARSAPGIPVLFISILAILAGALLLFFVHEVSSSTRVALVWSAVILFVAAFFALRGLTPVVVGEARAVQLFGSYRGTIRESWPARREPVHAEAGDLGPGQEYGDRAGQGQRRGRQPD